MRLAFDPDRGAVAASPGTCAKPTARRGSGSPWSGAGVTGARPSSTPIAVNACVDVPLCGSCLRAPAARGVPAAAGAPRPVPPVPEVRRRPSRGSREGRSSGPPAGRTTRTRSRSGSRSRSRACYRVLAADAPAGPRRLPGDPVRLGRRAGRRRRGPRRACGCSSARPAPGSGSSSSRRGVPGRGRRVHGPARPPAGALLARRRAGRGPGRGAPDAVLLPRLRWRAVRAAPSRGRDAPTVLPVRPGRRPALARDPVGTVRRCRGPGPTCCRARSSRCRRGRSSGRRPRRAVHP